MKILVHGLNYAPELVGIGKYTTEMCEWLAARGHDVRVITSYPHYPDWRMAEGPRVRTYSREVLAGVSILRCPLYVPAKPSGLRRILSHLSFAVTSLPPVLAAALRFRPDVVFGVAPSIVAAPAAWLGARACGAKAWLHIKDFEVEAAFDLGLLKGQRSRRIAEAIERWLLARFDRVSSISPRMVAKLEDRGVPVRRMRELRDWIDTRAVRPADRLTPLRAELGLSPDTVVALYSGSMAAKQGLEHLATAVQIVSASRPDVSFVFCGAGVMREVLRSGTAGLPNVHFIDLQPAARLGELLATADIHLLPQRSGIADLVMPSKLISMLASGRAIVAMAEPGTQVVAELTGRGLIVPTDDPVAFADAILRLAADPAERAAFGRSCRAWAVEHWDSEANLLRIEEEFGLLARPAAEKPAAGG